MASQSRSANLFILAFDHRGSFQKDLFGITGQPSLEQVAAIAGLKHVIFEGIQRAVAHGCSASEAGVLVDEQFGGSVPTDARAAGFVLAMPVERSGQAEFDFQYPDYRAHIEAFDPDYIKVLVRYNPDGDAAMNQRQTARLHELSDWLISTNRRFLFELLVPATATQLESVGGDVDRYDRDLRADLMVRTVAELQAGGVEPKIWKIEGLDTAAEYAAVARQCIAGGRDDVDCVVLGRGADDAKVDHWLEAAALVPRYIGFAIGRSIWLGPLKELRAGSIGRDEAVEQIAHNYARFISVFKNARLNP